MNFKKHKIWTSAFMISGILWVMAGGTATSQDNESRAKDLRTKGAQFLRQGEYSDALATYRKSLALQHDPNIEAVVKKLEGLVAKQKAKQRAEKKPKASQPKKQKTKHRTKAASSLGSKPVPWFTDNGNGTITGIADVSGGEGVGYMWQKSEGGKMDWNSAVSYCDSLSLAGYNDWRLPTLEALWSIFDRLREAKYPGAKSKSQVDKKYFPGTHSGRDDLYWVADQNEHYYGTANAAYDGGTHVSKKKSMKNYVRCVRGGYLMSSWPKKTFTGTGNGTVTDNDTGLMWQTGVPRDNLTWKAALSYCEKLSLDGKKDWRLPDIHELMSLLEFRHNNPDSQDSINDQYFPSREGYYPRYWSSSPEAGNSKWIWVMDPDHQKVDTFPTIAAAGLSQPGKNDARCVRGPKGAAPPPQPQVPSSRSVFLVPVPPVR